MPYQPGPLKLQAAGNVGIETSEYDFAGYAADQIGDIDVTLKTWDPLIKDAGLLLGEPADPFPDVDLNAALDVMGTYADPPALLGMDDIVTSLGIAGASLAAAIGAAPAEAWKTSAIPFVPPMPAEVVSVPTIPADLLSFLVVGTVASTSGTGFPTIPVRVGGGDGEGGTTTTPPVQLPPLSGPTIELTNTTTFNNSTFTVGDNYTVVAKGPAGATVSANASHNGSDYVGGPVGTIGADGRWSQDGQIQPGDVGVWTEQWWVGNNQPVIFNFIVLSAD